RTDEVVRERPGDRERRDRHPRLSRDLPVAFGRGERLLVDEARRHRRAALRVVAIEAEARAFGPSASGVLAGQDAPRDRAVREEAHLLAPAPRGELVLEATIQQSEFVLDRLVADEPLRF